MSHSIGEIKVNLANSVLRLRTIPTTEQKPSDSSTYSAFFAVVYVILRLARSPDLRLRLSAVGVLGSYRNTSRK